MLPLLLAASASATPTLLYQGTLQGGVSVDASGVTTAYSGATWRAGEDLIVQVPTGATISALWLVLLGQSAGWASNPAGYVRVNGVTLSGATLLSSVTRRRVYSLDPLAFGITGPGSFRYEEQDPADSAWHGAQGTSGAALIALYTHPTLPGRRHIVVGVDEISLDTIALSGLPTSGMSSAATLSIAVMGECSDEQSSSVYAGATLLSSSAGGRDDGGAAATSCAAQDWGSLITAGSFGFDNSDALIGTDSDSPSGEPGGTANNSLRSDELYSFSYNESGALNLSFYDYTGDARLEAFVLSIEADQDDDGVTDARDACPAAADPSQIDSDNDGPGDACDPCTDRDGDGARDNTVPGTCSADCDDGRADVYPGAPEVWYDGLDSDCSGGSDDDADGDGHDAASRGGTDCDDGRADVYPGAPDAWYDGTDSDCSGGSDDDADGDGHDAASRGGTDCDDGDPDVHPGAADTWYDGLDADCAGDDDFDADADGVAASRYGGTDCNDARPDVYPGAYDAPYDGLDADCSGGSDDDADGDGHDDDRFGGDDCDDGRADVYPGAADAWYDGTDSDCAGNDDYDADGDGFAVSWHGGADCDDTDGDIYPGSPEFNDGVDNDCNGLVEEGDPDGDGVLTGVEAAAGSDWNAPDTDGDSVHDLYELGDDLPLVRDTDGDGAADFQDGDDDDDGIPTAAEASGADPADPLTLPDTDGDLLPDHRDSDADGDGLMDASEGAADTDGDGLRDFQDSDDDGDGVPTAAELPAADTDGDGLPDHRDPDSDDDGLPDATDPDRLTPEQQDSPADSAADSAADSGTDHAPDTADSDPAPVNRDAPKGAGACAHSPPLLLWLPLLALPARRRARRA